MIANRGEIAVRILRACGELGMRTVGVYSEVDAKARHVLLADEAYLIGPASPVESYLNGAKLIQTALESGCDCVHPGYGFLSESEDFARAVLAAGLVWVGPPPEAIRAMGVKTEARALMQQANVPLAPGFQSDTASDAMFAAAAHEIGYPVMVKAAGGGGGKGIRVVYEADKLSEALQSARYEAGHAFGDARVFIEKYIESGRHIEVQVLADTQGNIVHLFERECSAQRRHQKIVEETPSPLLSGPQRAEIGRAAVEAARAVGYVNAGTVEFIATAQGDFYFLEMNTRLQVEHPVTELVTGVDIVKLQFHVAAGGALPFTQEMLSQHGHAIECRIYAEDAHSGFLPAVGPVIRFTPPEGPGIRVDSGIQSGDHITIHYDPMIAKLIVHASTREEAIARMQKALRDTVILGTTTNLQFLQNLLAHPAFLAGTVDTHFVDEQLAALLGESARLPDVVLIAAALAESALTAPEQPSAAPDEDVFSPWARLDYFRLGTRNIL